jgi:hypothetical protein
MGKAKQTGVVSVEQVTHSILIFRGHKVLLDSDLAELYGVPTKALNQAVKRNAERFPEDFMFRLSQAEAEALNRSQLVTGSQKHRELLASNRELARRFEQLEARVEKLVAHDQALGVILSAIRKLMPPPPEPPPNNRPIGFTADLEDKP